MPLLANNEEFLVSNLKMLAVWPANMFSKYIGPRVRSNARGACVQHSAIGLTGINYFNFIVRMFKWARCLGA